MKNKSVYRKKLTRVLKSAWREIDTLQCYTVVEACDRLVKISYKKGKY
jgi:hypothetical protein